MKITRNKLHLAFGILMLLVGLTLMVSAFIAQERPAGRFPLGAFGSIGILLVIGGAALLFSEPKIK